MEFTWQHFPNMHMHKQAQCNLHVQKVVTVQCKIQGHPWLFSEFETSYIRHCLKKMFSLIYRLIFYFQLWLMHLLSNSTNFSQVGSDTVSSTGKHLSYLLVYSEGQDFITTLRQTLLTFFDHAVNYCYSQSFSFLLQLLQIYFILFFSVEIIEMKLSCVCSILATLPNF